MKLRLSAWWIRGKVHSSEPAGLLRAAFLSSISALGLYAQTQGSSINGLPAIIERPRLESQATPSAYHYKGVVLAQHSDSVDVKLPDTRVLMVSILGATVKAVDLKTGDSVELVVTESNDGLFQAVSIKADSKGARTEEPSRQIKAASEKRLAGPLPTILIRPRWPEAAERFPAPTDSQLSFVEQARKAASTFLRRLPSYVCQESITRYVSENHEPNWEVVDTVTEEVMFEEGAETYRNIALNGKPSKKPPDESGTWSVGEFGTILGHLFAPAGMVQFTYVQSDTIGGQPASIYDFRVDQPHSAWHVQVPGQYILPSYKGSVWLGQQSARALRIEMGAKDIPKAFPRFTVETAVNYGYITLGTSEEFLLPEIAEVLSCSRASSQCERNFIAFHDCHRFTGESNIRFNPLVK